MKKSLIVLILSILAATGCSVRQNSNNSAIAGQINNEADLLNFYRQYGPYTDPGEYAYLYKNLPDSLQELCRLIRSQYINYGWELDMYREQIPRERWNESAKYPTVKSALKGLLSYDSRGLVRDRKPEDRLMLICRDNALLLASILKYRGIPARVRYGFAAYFIPGFHVNHVLCEVWNEKKNRWMLVDPSADRIDFAREEFDFSHDVWLKMRHKEINPEAYGMPGKNRYNGSPLMTTVVCYDLASILGTEYPVGQHAPILDYAFQNNRFTPEQVEILNRISELMKSIDVDAILKLQEIYNHTPQIQFTTKFEPVIINTENNARTKDSPIHKPIIEFVSIPGGTFLMGSPDIEHGRQEDEMQHQVTLSAFKMGKYCITYEQYDVFCEATGRKKPWGFKRGKLPVTQVTWYDAKAFADWMGCRLPTEAQFEYAARANTTTPFYTGDCLTTDQANFNGNAPYANCEKGEKRGEALPVGSFSPNAFGLHDMHGNIWEWTNDWYGKYDVNDKINPQGPETGTRRVDRGGGFYDPAWRCRSACRGGGTPPGNRGTGLSFRLVKSEQ
jgi:formylglycine-generating enzyme